MKIGIIVYSQTGNTRSVSEKLAEGLKAKGHDVGIEQIRPEEVVSPGMKHVRFITAPDVEPYDGIVFAAPVQAFSLASGMKLYMRQIGSLQDKKTACFVTKQLPGSWTGGKKAIRQLTDFCVNLGSNPEASEIIIWSSKDREKMIRDMIEAVVRVF